jgi:hypothetical protein
VSEILKMFEFAQQNRVAEMEVRRRRIKSSLHPQGFARCPRPLQLGTEFGLADDFRGALLDVGKLFVYGGEGWHAF